MRRFVLAFAFVTIAACAIAWRIQSSRLYVNGELASTNVIERNGVAYAPIKDMASAMKLTVQRTSRGIELSAAGGANQVEGITGKVGDMLFNGYARFSVLKVIRGKEYTNQFSGDSQKITPFPEGNDLVVLVCKIKNATNHKVTCALPAGEETGLTDVQDHSFAPRNGLSLDAPTRGAELLPGAAVDFALTFDVPASAELGELVYQVEFFSEPGVSKKKFRVSLKQ